MTFTYLADGLHLVPRQEDASLHVSGKLFFWVTGVTHPYLAYFVFF